MAKLTISDVERIAGRGRPWTIRLEFAGADPANAGGFSDKYWYATGRGLTEAVEIGWGANGNGAQHQLIDWPELRKRVAEKLAKGYGYVDTPYIRMTTASLARLGGPTKGTPAPVQVTPVPNPVPPPVTRSAALVALGEPWSLTHHLKVLRDGTTVKGYAAIDDNGDELLQFDPQRGVEFARDYNLEIELE